MTYFTGRVGVCYLKRQICQAANAAIVSCRCRLRYPEEIVMHPHRGKRFCFTVGVLAATLWLVGICPAQEITGSITGTIRDPSGAVVPNAQVVLTNVATGYSRRVSSNPSGVYFASVLPLGNYELTVEQTGFRRFVQKGIVLHVNDALTLNVTLELGAVTQEVKVEAMASPVQTETGDVSNLISGQQVSDLALNGRSFIQLTQLAPGVTSALPADVGFGLSGGYTFINVNGARTTFNNWMVDGGDNNDTGSNQTLLNLPSVDSIAEFRMLTSSYNAEFGRSAGAQINVVTKSGTKEFHGGVYEFIRNDALDARNYFAPDVSKLRRNNFGWTLGGPLYLPGHYNVNRDKTFFFFSQEWRRIRSAPETILSRVPTLLERTGDFSASGAPLIDPTTGTPFPGNAIPSAQIDANAKLYIDTLFPSPNTTGPGTLNYVSQLPGENNFRQELIRLDHHFSERHVVFLRYVQDTIPTIEPGGLWTGNPFPGVAITKTNVPGYNAVFNLTSTFGPRTLNQFIYNYSANAIRSDPIGKILYEKFPGLTIQLPYPKAARVPTIDLSDYTGISGNGPFHNRAFVQRFRDDFSRIMGNHFLKAGALLSWEGKDENNGGGNEGYFSFDGRYSGNSLADLMLGLPYFFSQNDRDVNVRLRYKMWEFYAQDHYKIRSNLSVNFGLRYTFMPPPHVPDNVLTNFLPRLYDHSRAVQIDPVTGNIIPGTGDVLNGIIIGTIKSPYGSVVQTTSYNNVAPRIGFSWDPFKTGRTAIRGGYGIFYDRWRIAIAQQPGNPPFNQAVTLFSAPPGATLTFSHPAAGQQPPLTPVDFFGLGDPFPLPTMHHWNVGVQREIVRGALLDVSYVGSAGMDLLQGVNLNQPLPGEAARLGVNVNAVRPYPGLARIIVRQPTADSRYHSLQVSFRGQLWDQLNFQTAYTWSKNMTDSTSDRESSDRAQNTRNLRAEWGRSGYDRTHVLTFNYVWTVPYFKNSKSLAKALVYGWEISGITSFWSGFPGTVRISSDIPGVGGGSPLRPNCAGDPNRVRHDPRSGLPIFDTSAFALPAPGTFGNCGRSVVSLPGVNNWDMSFFKSFTLHENFRLQFRSEFFNIFNHAQFDGVSLNAQSGSFGMANSARDPRIIQFGLKLLF